MPGGHCGDPLRIIRRCVAAPDHVQVGPHQNEVVSVHVARRRPGQIKRRERRADSCKRRGQRRDVGAAAAEPQQRIAVADAVLRGAIGIMRL